MDAEPSGYFGHDGGTNDDDDAVLVVVGDGGGGCCSCPPRQVRPQRTIGSNP
uniref:Putative serine/threonine-protein kinase At4g35230 n=1 Tax=Rhizophora mucronata TaxID=61149 RepID=A0A2P2K636_RHIMU